MSQADEVYGPNTAAIQSVIDRLRVMTAEESTRFVEVRGASLGSAWNRRAAWDAAWDAAWEAAWDGAWDGEWTAAWNATWDSVWGSIVALIVRDLISADDFETLVRPWVKVMGRTWE